MSVDNQAIRHFETIRDVERRIHDLELYQTQCLENVEKNQKMAENYGVQLEQARETLSWLTVDSSPTGIRIVDYGGNLRILLAKKSTRHDMELFERLAESLGKTIKSHDSMRFAIPLA